MDSAGGGVNCEEHPVLDRLLVKGLGSRPLPKSNDLMPETLRRIVAMSTAASAKSPIAKSSACSTFRAAGSAIAAGVHR